MYYMAATNLREGADPYKDYWYIYPPFWAFVLVPLSYLTPQAFALLWTVLLGALWATSTMLIRVYLDRDSSRWSLLVDVGASAILFRAIWSAWGHGQIALLILVSLTIIAILDRRQQSATAAGVLALAGAIKVFPLFWGILFLRTSWIRRLPHLAVGSALLWVSPCLLIGPTRYFHLIENGFFTAITSGMSARLVSWDNRSLIPTLYRHVELEDLSIIRTGVWGWMLLCAGTLLVLWNPTFDTWRRRVWFSLLMTSTVLACPVVWPHYFGLLLLPLTTCLAIAEQPPLELESASRGLRLSCIAVALMLNLDTRAIWGIRDNAVARLDLPTAGVVVLWISLIILLLKPPPQELQLQLALRASPEA